MTSLCMCGLCGLSGPSGNSQDAQDAHVAMFDSHWDGGGVGVRPRKRGPFSHLGPSHKKRVIAHIHLLEQGPQCPGLDAGAKLFGFSPIIRISTTESNFHPGHSGQQSDGDSTVGTTAHRRSEVQS